MGADCAVDPFGEARRRQAARGYASGDERRDVCAEHRMPVALYPQGLAAAQHGEPLFFATGVMTARWIASITHCICNAARNSNAKPVPPLVSLIVKASKAPKKGGADWPAWVFCGGGEKREEKREHRPFFCDLF